MRLDKKMTIVLAGIVAVGAAGGLAAAAAATQAAPSIHACAARHGGALRIAASCKPSERPVTWNVRGPRGGIGRRGPAGTFDAADVQLVRYDFTVQAGMQKYAWANCPAGTIAISGGAAWAGGGNGSQYVSDTGPYDGSVAAPDGGSPNRWFANMTNLGSADKTAYVWAYCA